MAMSGSPSKLQENVLRVLRRTENKFKHTIRELRVVQWRSGDGVMTAPHLQAVEKRRGLGDNEYVTGTKALSPDDWTSCLAARDEITALMIKVPKEKQETHDHD